MKEFIFGKYKYQYKLIRQNRKTLALTVTPDLKIIVKVPDRATDERIEAFLRRKWFWLEKQLSFFRKYQKRSYQKEYLSGESFLYLGRQYKMIVRKSTEDSVNIGHGQIFVMTSRNISNGIYNKRILERWFNDRINLVFNERFLVMLEKFDYEKIPQLDIREMKRRWGSFLSRGVIFLNPKLIHASKDCIDYVITHELCHLKYRDHNQYFWKLLDKKYPKWEKVKNKLEMYTL